MHRAATAAPYLVLALGNDLLLDDSLGPMAGEILEAEAPVGVDVLCSSEAGLALMELMCGYRRVVLLDAIQTGRHEPGTILRFGPEDLQEIVAPSPHYAGLPEVLAMAARLGIDFPEELVILAVEVENLSGFGERMLSEPVARALPLLVAKTQRLLAAWSKRDSSPDWNGARGFHGHLGPWMGLGMRLGEQALRRLETTPFFGLSVEARLEFRPPVSCLLDGLSWSTGATYGKRNLRGIEGAPFQVRFETKQGEALLCELSEGLPQLFTSMCEEFGEERAARMAYDADEGRFYRWVGELATARTSR